MLSRFLRSLSRWASNRSNRVLGGPDLEPRIRSMIARWQEIEEKAWWKDLTGLVGETDRQLVVIGPRSDATADDLRALAQAIERWKADNPQARHVWGLVELLDGRSPR